MKIKINWKVCFFVVLFSILFLPLSVAKGDLRMVVTVITASNEGTDFNLDNDAYRDQLLQLFSYSAYEQKDQFLVELEKAVRKKAPLFGDYELVLTLQNQENDRIFVEALIRKNGIQYVNTVLSILEGGVVFLGGPETEEGALILVIENS